MSNSSTVQMIDKQIQHSKELVELGKCLERLRSNRDFKKIITEGYLEQESIRLVMLKADYNMQTADKQASVVKQMDSIGTLSQYFDAVRVKAGMAEKAIGFDEDVREQLLEEGV